MNNDVFGRECSDSPIIFTSDAVTIENYWRITSWVTKNSFFMATHLLFDFLHIFLALKQRQTNETTHGLISALVGWVGCGILMSCEHLLWRHSDCLNDSNLVMCIFPPLSSWLILVIESDSWHFHCLGCKMKPLIHSQDITSVVPISFDTLLYLHQTKCISIG